MKKLISLFLILFFLFVTDASSTIVRDTLPIFDSADALIYKSKAKVQATTGTVLLAGGSIMATVGYGLAMAGLSHLFDPNYQPRNYGSLPEILGFGGLALAVTGIVLLKASIKNKRKAKIILSNRNLSLPQTITRIKRQMSAGIVINF